MTPAPRDVSSRILIALRDWAARSLGAERAQQILEEVCADRGIDVSEATDERSFACLELFHSVVEAYRPHLSEDFVVEAVMATIQERRERSAMSLSSIATPAFFYRTLDRARGFYARHVSFEVDLTSRGSATAVLRYRDGVPRRRESCDVGKGVLAAVPLLFDLPAATVAETECYAEGAEACRYRVSWRAGFPFAAAGALAGAAVGGAGLLVAPHFAWAGALLVGWLSGREIDRALLRRHMARALEEQRRLLGENERDFQRRFAEILELKETLEQRVEERTRDIRETMEELSRQNAHMRQALAELEAMQSDVVEAGIRALIGEVMGELSHEIGNPLSYVLTNLSVLEEVASTPEPGSSPLEVEELGYIVSDIRHGVEQMRGVLGWFLEVYRSTGQRERSRLDLDREVRAAAAILHREWSNRIQLHLDLGGVPAVSAYGKELVQVLVNLLVNASHAVEEGNIWIRTRAEEGKVRLTVRDDGRGMSREELRRACERGFTTKEPHRGSGLGLFISKAIVERHEGTLSIESAPGEGTSATIEVPAAADQPAKLPQLDSSG